ncbi:hypothetical protein [Sporofaciens musculi]|uniref:hypothetical protein n=1 Tax=Sporofaciens musculi TaxID=2681861 RepID=UPI0025A139DE|nr:hypothetical protein [Sporofaciens musculi]
MDVNKQSVDKKLRDFDWAFQNAKKQAEKSERMANFSLGFSAFTWVFILVIELFLKK